MGKRSQQVDFLAAFQELNLSAQRTFTFRTHRAEPPTWGQLKKLTQEAEGVVQQAGQPKTSLTLFLAMLAVVNCQSAGNGAKGQTPNPNEPNM
nr:pyrin domain-containing protein 3-like [Chlorocebus sabaeus]